MHRNNHHAMLLLYPVYLPRSPRQSLAHEFARPLFVYGHATAIEFQQLLAACYLEEWMSRFETKPYPPGLLQPKML
jgi:hypothetical protein